MRGRTLIVGVLVTLIVIAHVFLWRSDIAFNAKLAFTIINATGWTIILAPIFLVDKWLDTITAKNQETDQ
ncbi:phenylalanyl-tRNA synthetase subunit beta [Nereida sp. MMG025]|uniref:phenylalanyl-tRNA synthetase subunit beta n=1 Tax=Nereida sp. MMG025 TaxID=2909981 RepID=UPI001F40CFC3|nr:phenylalanyl-tRNA synthetase subunit beta [Nereida sp. MMG025]MCF6444323.1 phenylalanyl-tRNA synthetase subunit beta [Nereida sp. MMG025]